MSGRKTMVWLVLAAGLFCFIFFYQRHVRPPVPAGRLKVLPELHPEEVSSILVRPSGPGQMQIRVDRTNGVWMMTQPLVYPAQAERVQKLLRFLQQLRPSPYLSAAELRNHRDADEEYGFATPQATLVIQQGSYSPRLRVGGLTNPGDQVFLQVEGDLGAYVVDAELLKDLPHSADDWRDTSLLDLRALAYDHIGVTNNAKADSTHPGLPASTSSFVLQRDPTHQFWRMVWPLDARANGARIEEALRKLEHLRVCQFVSDDPKTDLESFGLAQAELELGLGSGTNTPEVIQFGRCPSNDVAKVYAHRVGQPGVVTVNKDLLLSWCSVLNDFRDPHLLAFSQVPESVELVDGTNRSSLQRQAEGGWRLLPDQLSADENLAAELFSILTNLEVKFVNDVVNPADLPQYGLAPPLYRVLLRSKGAPLPAAATNTPVLELDFGFGTNGQDKIFAKRTDESFVYAISTNDFARLPKASWQLRDRVICHFSVADVAGLTLRQGAKVCQMIHKGPLSWTFAPGSQGIINDAAVEETVRGVVQTSAIGWVARGEASLAPLGIGPDAALLKLDFKNGESFQLEFGGMAPSGNIYAAVRFGGEPWVMEFPWLLFRDLGSYLPLRLQR